MTLEQIEVKIRAAIEEATGPLKTEIDELKKVRRVNRWIIVGLGVLVVIVGPIFAASLMSGNFGIGIASPADTLDVNGDIRVRGADIKDTGGTNRVRLIDNGNTVLNDRNGNASLTVDSAGALRIGTGTGDLIAGGLESLRFVRGWVSGTGAPLRGTGFTVSNPATGHYSVTYTNAFPSEPDVFCTVHSSDGYCFSGSNLNGSVQIFIRDAAGTPMNGIFHFMSLGPR